MYGMMCNNSNVISSMLNQCVYGNLLMQCGDIQAVTHSIGGQNVDKMMHNLPKFFVT